MSVAVIGDEHPLVLCVETDSMRIGEPDMRAFQDTKRLVIPLGHLAMHDNFIVMLNGEEDLLGLFVDCNAICSVRRMQRPVRAGVPSRIPREDRERIECVVVDGINIAGLRVDIQAAVELNFRVVSGNDALRLRQARGGRSVRQTVVDHNLKKVLVLKNDFIVNHIHGDGAVGWKRIANRPQRRSFQCPVVCCAGDLRPVLPKFGKQR